MIDQRDDSPPTVKMETPRVTNQTSWENVSEPGGWPNQPLQQQAQPPGVSARGGGGSIAGDQTLPLISLVLGVLGIVLSFCCGAGIPLGAGAMVLGFLGMNNVKKDPDKYGGRGLAVAGLILGAVGFFISIFIILVSVITG